MRFLTQAITLALLVILSTASLTEAQSENLAEIVREEVEAMMAQTEFASVSVAIVERGENATYHFGRLSDGSGPDDENFCLRLHGVFVLCCTGGPLCTMDDPRRR